jgi:hypothetical protein
LDQPHDLFFTHTLTAAATMAQNVNYGFSYSSCRRTRAYYRSEVHASDVVPGKKYVLFAARNAG